VAGCGADAAPYFRIFNPILQGQKFDPDGAYVRHFAPEIAGLPDTYLHAPWTGCRRGVGGNRRVALSPADLNAKTGG
jgi:deoxyribodipyrimidine photolyase